MEVQFCEVLQRGIRWQHRDLDRGADALPQPITDPEVFVAMGDDGFRDQPLIDAHGQYRVEQVDATGIREHLQYLADLVSPTSEPHSRADRVSRDPVAMTEARLNVEEDFRECLDDGHGH
jgi:hypothetical protein